MNLTTRAKWLTGIAAAVAAYVEFGPKDPEPVGPTQRAAAAPAARAPRAVGTPSSSGSSTAPIARSLLQLAHRVVDSTAAGSLFAAHSWYVAPPPPPAPPVETAPAVPPTPVAPPLPFSFIGSYTPDGAKPVFFLTQGDRVYDVQVGDTVDDIYTVDSFTDGMLIFTYKPLNQKQQLATGGVP